MVEITCLIKHTIYGIVNGAVNYSSAFQIDGILLRVGRLSGESKDSHRALGNETRGDFEGDSIQKKNSKERKAGEVS
jgi:hypothetical protein